MALLLPRRPRKVKIFPVQVVKALVRQALSARHVTPRGISAAGYRADPVQHFQAPKVVAVTAATTRWAKRHTRSARSALGQVGGLWRAEIAE